MGALNRVVWILLLALPSVAISAPRERFQFSVEPIVGFERVQKVQPEGQFRNRFFYGARFIGGLSYLSLEGELTRGADTEYYASTDRTQKDVEDRLKLGVRSSLPLNKFISAHARGGGQASRNTQEIIEGGSSTKSVGKISYSPYAGAGVRSQVSSYFSLSGDLVVVFQDFPNMKKNDYQTTFGFSLQFP